MPTSTRAAARKAAAAGPAVPVAAAGSAATVAVAGPVVPLMAAGSAPSHPQRSIDQDLCNQQLWREMAAMGSPTPSSSSSSSSHGSVSSGSETSEPKPTGGLMLAIRPLLYWLLLLFLLLSACFFVLAGWVPATLQSTCPSLCPTTMDNPAPLQAIFQGLGHRLDILNIGASEQAHTVDEFGDRLAGLHARSEEHRAQLDQVEQLRNLLGLLDSQVDTHRADLAAAIKPKPRRINWLSFDLGARAVPQLSSPTAYFQDLTAAEIEALDYGLNAALQPWLEYEPRYCTEGTSLQLAARLTRPIVPRELVMEYYSRAEVPAVGAAPREVELWIPIPDPDTRESVVRTMTSLHPDIFHPTEHPARNTLLDSHWVPIGRWTYDVLADEPTQSMHVPVELDSLGVKINQVLIRANSNWGNKMATCLVRVRLFGVDKSGLIENLDD